MNEEIHLYVYVVLGQQEVGSGHGVTMDRTQENHKQGTLRNRQ